MSFSDGLHRIFNKKITFCSNHGGKRSTVKDGRCERCGEPVETGPHNR